MIKKTINNMKNKIDLVELLKDCPKGMELDCSIYDNVTLVQVKEGYDYPIVIETPNGQMLLSKYGCFSKNELAKCVIFPKGKTTWDGFVSPYRFKDGDIVYTDFGDYNIIGILKKLHKEFCYCYVCLNKDGELQIPNLNDISAVYCTSYAKEIRLATEEEKKKLFDAIKDNGYKWNPEIKTLEKLPKFKVGDRIKHKTYISQGVVVTEIRDTHYILDDESALPFTFQDEYDLVPNKFDITTLKPFKSEVLVRNYESDYWKPAIFGFVVKEKNVSFCVEGGNFFNKCIPYEGNEHLLGTTDDCDDFYKL